jgi:hypothetical protein
MYAFWIEGSCIMAYRVDGYTSRLSHNLRNYLCICVCIHIHVFVSVYICVYVLCIDVLSGMRVRAAQLMDAAIQGGKTFTVYITHINTYILHIHVLGVNCIHALHAMYIMLIYWLFDVSLWHRVFSSRSAAFPSNRSH